MVMSKHNATLTLLHDCGPGGDNRYHVTVTVTDGDFDLGTYDDISDAAKTMGAWVRHRGLQWASDSQQRLADCQRTDSPVLVLDAVDRFDATDMRLVADWERRQAWHTVDYYPYVHTAHRMGC
jgi:hypothetical protein